MTTIEYEKTDDTTLSIIETPAVVPVVRTVGLDELIASEAKLAAKLDKVRDQIRKCQELGIKSKSEKLAENDTKMRAEVEARRA